ncbi:transcription elongation factor GreA [Clostridium cellulovorans]|uniref:Transcription elongation factor GreA n=1 Tax=Clostridium cellulovorans (strain ATCC 35296 / DSM 3052 / OCM 3 / 743B) TaxID=573061 RepID=D9SXE8_CLOC7|nr:transcription elongation factor GreA [Clostridium cellulovorans]ADL53451.1 transcription elongation factor GreA [Clostridium cellulovorans 743B]
MDSKKYVMTYEGLKKLEDELEFLKTVRRNDIKEKIKVALSFGDLSENSEYDEAKNEQAFVEGKIAQLEAMLKKVTVVDETDIQGDIVGIGTKVKVKDIDSGDVDVYSIVGSAEADPLEFKISHESPVGKAMLGKKVGETVDVAVPDGTIKLEILEITK